MTDLQVFAQLHGAESFIDWNGGEPIFHDAEVVSIELQREGASRLTIHVFKMTSDVTEGGHFRTINHALLTFCLEELTHADIAFFNHQNVLFGLSLREVEEGLELDLDPSYGVQGKLVAKKVWIEWKSGIPPGSVYGGAPST